MITSSQPKRKVGSTDKERLLQRYQATSCLTCHVNLHLQIKYQAHLMLTVFTFRKLQAQKYAQQLLSVKRKNIMATTAPGLEGCT